VQENAKCANHAVIILNARSRNARQRMRENKGICPTPANAVRGRTMPFALLRSLTAFIITAIFTVSFFINASALTVTQVVESFLSNMITAVYAEKTDFTAAQINAEIRRTVRAVERTGMLDSVTADDGVIEFDWLTLFWITDWFFMEMIIEVLERHDYNGFHENSEYGYGYTFVGDGFAVEFPRIDEMCLIIAAIENNIVDWNPVIIADANGIIEIGGFSVSDIKRILGWGADGSPEDDELTTDEQLEILINRVDIIAGILIAVVAVGVAVLFCYLIYCLIIRFM
jgi:hypothetical protein